MNMKLRYRLFLRRKTFTSLKTKDKAFDLIRDSSLIETQAEHLLTVLRIDTVSANVFLRKVQNFSVDLSTSYLWYSPSRMMNDTRSKMGTTLRIGWL